MPVSEEDQTPPVDPDDEGSAGEAQHDVEQTVPGRLDLTDHDPTGLNLARTIAGAVSQRAGGRRRRRYSGPARRVDPRSAGAHPDDRDPQLLTSAMDRLIDSQGWSREVSVHTLLGKWPSLVGPDNAAHSTPTGYHDAVLTVRADSTAWATQLRLMAPRIVAKLNEMLGDGTVTRLTILGPDVPSWKHGRRSVRDGRGPRDTYG